MGKWENRVENYLKSEVEKIGGMCRKWTGHVGVPDQIVFYKNHVFFVETKTATGKLSPQQIREHKRLKMQGAKIHTCYVEFEIDKFINHLKDIAC